MEFWKKNGFQLLTLALCAVLLVQVQRQSEQLRDLRQQMNFLESSVNNSYEWIARKIESAQEEAERVVEDWALEPRDVNTERRELETAVRVHLRRWQEDTAVTLHYTVNGVQTNLPLTAEGDGVFSGLAAFPLEQTGPLALEVEVRSSNGYAREELGAWDDLAMLLPAQFRGHGGAMPDYTAGMLKIRMRYGFDVEGINDKPIDMTDTELRIYRNGKLELTQKAVLVDEGEIAMEEESRRSYESTEEMILSGCREGDVLRLTAVATDPYGLTYESTLESWTVKNGALEDRHDTAYHYPQLLWD